MQWREWWLSRFKNPELMLLMGALIAFFSVVVFMNDSLAPVFAGIAIAYLIDGLVNRLERIKVPHFVAVLIVFMFMLGLVLVGILGIFPLLWQQAGNLARELPIAISQGQHFLLELPKRYPDFVTANQIDQWLAQLQSSIARISKLILSASLTKIPNIIALLVYCVLVPMLVYFFLMDKRRLVAWCGQYIPQERRLLSQVWSEVNTQISNYIRGRALEIVLVSVVSFITFALFGLRYAVLLSVLVGLSVLVPYVGIVVVTIPVLIIALVQWGWSAHFAYLTIAYFIIAVLDGNLLVPVLFSEVLKVHPVAIIVALLFFGSLWGFWGIFFAIPLAALVKSVLHAWQFPEGEKST